MTDARRKRFESGFSRGALNECWLWTRALSRKGYGRFGHVRHYAHRIAYELYRGPIPPGLTIDHLCKVRHCVNPWHMETVSVGENARRGRRHYSERTHCKHGHEYTPENTHVSPRGWRVCRACKRRNALTSYVRANRRETA